MHGYLGGKREKAKVKNKGGSYSTLFVLAGLVAVVDQFTKWLVVTSFDLYEVIEVIPGFFNLTYLRNTGAAFGLLANANPAWRIYFFVGVSVLALFFVLFVYRHYRQLGLAYVLAFSGIAGGALGNLIDRIRYGSVVDFLDFYYGAYHWPAFNVADSAIVVGVALFMIGGFFEKDDRRLSLP